MGAATGACAAALALAGCGVSGNPPGWFAGESAAPVAAEPDAPAPEEVAAPQAQAEPEAAAAAWVCAYDPTYNDDWHDDVLCANGLELDRPYLLEGDDFVTEDEIIAAAREYEAALNGAG